MGYCDGALTQVDITELPGFKEKLMNARTVAFVSLVWSENVRSYTSRSFDRPVWRDVLGNVQMQKAICLAQICLYTAVMVPYFSDKILKLRGIAIGYFGWLMALAGPVGCLVLCEACKIITAYQMRRYQRQLAARQEKAGAAAALEEKQKKGQDDVASKCMYAGCCRRPTVPALQQPLPMALCQF